MLTGLSRLLPAHLADWVRAMTNELTEIRDDKAAILFAAGCLRAALALAAAAQLQAVREVLSPARRTRAAAVAASVRARPRLLGLLCGVGAGGLGMAHLFAAGAPNGHLLVNLVALLLGTAAWFALRRAAALRTGRAGMAVLALALPLLLTALFGVTAEGATRWVSIGPVSLQASFLLMPVMMVIYARRPDEAGTGGIVIAALALALQPDPAMAGALSMGLLALVFSKGGRLPVIAAAASLLALGWAMIRGNAQHATPFVDSILDIALNVHPLVGSIVLLGSVAVIAPALLARAAGDRPALFAFGGCWAGTLVAAALGNYPTPLVGYGGSAVLGYLLSVALLPPGARETRPAKSSSTRTLDGRSADLEPSELRVAPCA
jgi:hypothetical protein